MSDKITAKTICALLGKKHSDDVFVSECKSGGTFGGHFRLDGWAMKKSWSNPLSIGYEVKVSRNDFIRDEKWHNYLQFCNELYFVCTYGLILPEECPEQAGLMYVSKTGSMLRIKKKAPRREVVIPEDLYKYILFSRAEITPPRFGGGMSNKEFWQHWLEVKSEDLMLGQRISKRLNKLIKEKIETVGHENSSLKRRMENYDDLIKFLPTIGIDPDSLYSWKTKEKLREMASGIPEGMLGDVKSLSKGLDGIIKHIEHLMDHKP